jgi:cell division protein FtsW (lipid II flippase)
MRGGPGGQVLYRVAERQTDFVFAALGNRWGFFGGFLMLLLFAWLLVAILAVAARHRDPAARLLCLGVFAMLGGQAFINLAMSVGLMPVTGLTLPFVSYGRSSVVVCILSVALVCNVAPRPAYGFGRGDFDGSRLRTAATTRGTVRGFFAASCAPGAGASRPR